MKIKYTGSYDTIQLYLFKEHIFPAFYRNQWKDVPDNAAKLILKNNQNFYCEDDFIFNTEDFLNNPRNICISRFGALGDLIQLLPIMRYFKKHSKSTYTLSTSKQYVEIFKPQIDCFDSVIESSNTKKTDFDKVIMLDGVLENDHSLVSEDRLIHRTRLYEKFFGVKLDSYDFTMRISQNSHLVARELLNAVNVQ